MPHSPIDVYAQFRAIDKQKFGTSVAIFRSRYAVMGGYNQKEVVAWIRTDTMKKRIDEVAHRVDAEEVLTLPEFVDSTCVTVQLGE